MLLFSVNSRGASLSLLSSSTLRSFSDWDRNRTRTRFLAYSGRVVSVSESGAKVEGRSWGVEVDRGTNGDSHPSGDSKDRADRREE